MMPVDFLDNVVTRNFVHLGEARGSMSRWRKRYWPGGMSTTISPAAVKSVALDTERNVEPSGPSVLNLTEPPPKVPSAATEYLPKLMKRFR
jgi:hypothetical protein